MRFPDLRPCAFLLLADLALLWLLQGTLGALLPPGLPGLWLEGTLRLGGLWWLLKVGGLLGLVGTLLPPLCLGTPLFLSLRALVPRALGAPPVRVASVPWSWLLVGYAAAWLSWAMWALLSSPGARERKQGQENNTDLMWRLLKLSWPDVPYLVAAFFFLIIAVLGETVIPYYSGHVIDILRGDFDPDAFASTIFFMCLFSIGSPSPCLPLSASLLPLMVHFPQPCISFHSVLSPLLLALVPSCAPVSPSSPFPPSPTAHCVPAAGEAASPSPCPESMCGSGSCFSPPFCARTSVSSRILRQGS